MAALARLIITNYRIAVASNFGSFNIRLPGAIIMILSKIELEAQQDNNKEHKRILNFESDHFSFSLNLDLIICFFARSKRLKHINTFLISIFFQIKTLSSLNLSYH